jgi:plastocyanin domain-containing protein
MQLYALGTGSAVKGALSMFVFALGTVPLMLAFGAISGLLSKGFTKKLLKFSGILVMVLGLIMGSRGMALAGVNLPSLKQFNPLNPSSAGASAGNIAKAEIKDGVQTINMTADSRGYTPNAFYVQRGIPVKWIIDGKQLNSCNGAIAVPSLDKQLNLKNGENVIEFTPDNDKDVSFSCWMGMIRGVIKVVDKLDTVDTSKSDPSIPPPSTGPSCCAGGPPPSQSQSIYGDDISKVKTDRLVRKASVKGGSQSVSIKGTGYEFDPLIVVVQKGVMAKISFDLSSFDNPEGTFKIIPEKSSSPAAAFEGAKGTSTLEYTFNKAGGYGILKDNSVLGIIEVVDNIKTADLEAIRSKYLK